METAINDSPPETPNLTMKLIQRNSPALKTLNHEQKQSTTISTKPPKRGVPITKQSRKTIPWKHILLAVTLFTIGVVGITIGSLMKVGYITKNNQISNSLLIVSSVAFLPGIYGVILAYNAWQKKKGYDWDTVEMVEFT